MRYSRKRAPGARSQALNAILTITASTPWGERSLKFPVGHATTAMVGGLADGIGMSLSGPLKRLVSDQIEIAKTYRSEAEYRITWEGGFRISISRSPQPSDDPTVLDQMLSDSKKLHCPGLYLGLM